ncbi:MAG: hypothetical protein IBX68_04065 [Dehalococcoidia bacterium]|nr:hypothetical protein [Dehalococcoidia bacterium]
MEIMRREDLQVLFERRDGPAVSIYLPTHRKGAIEEDRIRFKNSLREAEGRLEEFGVRSTIAKDILQPARRLMPDDYFWQHQGDGLAVFASPEIFQYFRLPTHFSELVAVSERFHIKPLLPLFTADGLFYVLALSQNKIRLLQCYRDMLRPVILDNVPQSLDEALAFDDPQRQLQFHSRTGDARGSRRAAIFHGHGSGKDDAKTDIQRYLQIVNRGLHEVLRQEQAPLVIAAVDYLHPIYRSASSYRHLMAGGIEGNPDIASDESLHREAWNIVMPYFQRGLMEALRTFGEAEAAGLGTTDIKESVVASFEGRVSTLIVALGAQQWGIFEPDNHDVYLHEASRPGNEDLLDFAVFHTVIKGGTVHAVDPDSVPGSSTIAAILRF